jgi:hypothetical protein
MDTPDNPHATLFITRRRYGPEPGQLQATAAMVVSVLFQCPVEERPWYESRWSRRPSRSRMSSGLGTSWMKAFSGQGISASHPVSVFTFDLSEFCRRHRCGAHRRDKLYMPLSAVLSVASFLFGRPPCLALHRSSLATPSCKTPPSPPAHADPRQLACCAPCSQHSRHTKQAARTPLWAP